MNHIEQMADFWEKKFREVRTAWGHEPVDSAIFAKNVFLEQNIKNILIPGIGFGRNARVFIDNNTIIVNANPVVFIFKILK